MRSSSAEPLGPEDVDRAVAEVEQREGAHVLRAVAFGDVDVSSADPRVVVAAGQRSASPRAGIEVQGIVPHAGTDVTVERLGPAATLVRSREAQGDVRRLVHVCARPAGRDTGAQVGAALHEVEQTLALAGMTPHHLDRTWFFLDAILDTYPQLNRARDEAFSRWGITSYPASTGIGASLGDDGHAAVVAEACSVDGRPVAQAFGTALQCAPVEYGPRFARATRMERNGLQVVNISGISSIDDEGASLTSSSADVVVAHAMASFVDLLRTAGLAVEDVCSSYVYSKDDEARSAFSRWCEAAGVRLPVVHNAVDVCRPELRFEIEGRAERRAPVSW